jgi:hypothetical protein
MDSLGIDFSAGVKRGTAATDIFCPVHPVGLKAASCFAVAFFS